MPGQVHAVMKEAQDVNHVAILSGLDSEQDEMLTLAPVPRKVKRPNVAANFLPFRNPVNGRTGAKGFQRRWQGVGINPRLR